MGQKVNPHGLRVGVIKDWDSKWFAKDHLFGDILVEDKKIRDYLKQPLFAAGVPTIRIERDPSKIRIFIHCAKPGMVIGKGGAEIEKLRLTWKGHDRSALSRLDAAGLVLNDCGKAPIRISQDGEARARDLLRQYGISCADASTTQMEEH